MGFIKKLATEGDITLCQPHMAPMKETSPLDPMFSEGMKLYTPSGWWFGTFG